MFSDLKPYPEYVDGRPLSWRRARLGSLGRLFKGNGGSKADNVANGLPVVRYGELYTRFTTVIDRAYSFIAPEAADRYTRLRRGDLVFAASGESIEDIGTCAVVLLDGDVRCGGDTVVFRPAGSVDPTFLSLALATADARQRKGLASTGTMIVHIGAGALKTMPVVLPPEDEQAAIVAYLAYAHQRINRAIAMKRRLTASLREIRSVVVEEMLRNAACEVGWPELPLRAFLDEIDERAGAEAQAHSLLSVSIHTGVGLRREKTTKASRAADLSRYKLARSGSLVLNRMRAFQGALGVAHVDGLVSPDYLVAKIGRNANSEFVEHVLRTPAFANQMARSVRGIGSAESGGSRTPRINARDFFRLSVPVPAVEDQVAIVERIEAETARIDRQIDLAHREIALLEEFKTRLTSDVVTGQVDVRAIAATLPPIDPVEAFAAPSGMADAAGDDEDEAPVEE